MQTRVDSIATSLAPLERPYLLALHDGRLSRADFIHSQMQFYAAVVFFSRPMATVAARIPTQARRLEVIRNVWEEHGEGEPGRFHGATFLELLRRLDGTPEEAVTRTPLWPEVHAFNVALMGAALSEDFRLAVAMLGMIEHLFVNISASIGRGIVGRGWLSETELVHYDLHERLDVRHASDFFDVVRADFADADHREVIEQGLWLGGTLFMRLYDDLWAHRARRGPMGAALTDG